MNFIILAAAGLVAILDWLAVWRQWRRVGFIAKPFTIILLLTGLIFQTSLQGFSFWFGLGLLFSLVGDVLLMLPARFFLVGLASFALVHLAYFTGFLQPFHSGNLLTSGLLAVILVSTGIFLMGRIWRAQVDRGLRRLTIPTMFYAFLINLMVLSAMLSWFRPDWDPTSSLMVSLGALLFYISDLTNAWIRFVNPLRSGRLAVMVSYHLGQFLIISGVMLHFSFIPVV
jgi:alkenylglycerophosphocholine/alkenylglycerophosphoethanolamine hydrolase